MSKRTLIAFVIDESGSMQNCRDETVSGFNAYIKDQKEIKDSEAFVSLTKFNSAHKIVYISKPIGDVANLSIVETTGESAYTPNGYTALYDAIGFTINALWFRG